jgi:UDPglucose 6-dehydrogenase
MNKCRAEHPDIPTVDCPYKAAEDADALVIATEWNEFKELDWVRIRESMRAPLVFDGRNLLNPDQMRQLGFEYYCIGR